MESPFEILERRDDHAHSDKISREKLVLPKQTRNWGGSSTRERLWGLAGGLETSNLRGNFTGLRVIFLFCLVEEELILHGPGGPRAGRATSTYSTRPSSTTSDIFTPGLDAVSLRGVPPWYQRSLVSSAVRRRDTTRSQQAHNSETTWRAEADSTTLHGA